MAEAITANVNNSREPVLATCNKAHGRMRLPAINITAIKAETWSKVSPIINQIDFASVATAAVAVAALSPNKVDSGGNKTKTKTVTKSSTTKQPTVIFPGIALIKSLASNAFKATTVLAQDSDNPTIKLAPHDHPQHLANKIPKIVEIVICVIAPGTAIFLTDIKSFVEKCSPTPNINNITPISESCLPNSTSAVNPGLPGPIKIPAIRYPTKAGVFRRSAIKPKAKAILKPAARIVMSGVECSIL